MFFSPKLISYNPNHKKIQNYTLDDMKIVVFKCIISYFYFTNSCS